MNFSFLPVKKDLFPRTSILSALFFFAIFLSWPFDSAAQIKLAWDPNTEADLAGYKVYYGTASRTYGEPIDVGNVPTCTVPGLTEGVTYYFAVTAYNFFNIESDYSNEVYGRLREIISVPNAINGPTSGTMGQPCTYTAAGSSSTLGHAVEYQFDWKGNASDLSSWGSAIQSKTWTTAGTYNVGARARCVTHTSVVSSWFGVFSVNITSAESTSITPQSPSDEATFSSFSLLNKYQPSFSWTPIGIFKKYTILFSTSPTDFTTKGVSVTKASVPVTETSFIPALTKWKKIMRSSYNDGNIRHIYWKIAGERRDGTVCDAEGRSFQIKTPDVVTIITPQNGAAFSAPPAFEFSSNGNTKFKLEISSQPGFDDPKEIKKFSFTIKDPNAEQVILRTLTSSQWTAVKKLVGTATGYFRLRAWDGIKRETVSDVRSFTAQ